MFASKVSVLNTHDPHPRNEHIPIITHFIHKMSYLIAHSTQAVCVGVCIIAAYIIMPRSTSRQPGINIDGTYQDITFLIMTKTLPISIEMLIELIYSGVIWRRVLVVKPASSRVREKSSNVFFGTSLVLTSHSTEISLLCHLANATTLPRVSACLKHL